MKIVVIFMVDKYFFNFLDYFYSSQMNETRKRQAQEALQMAEDQIASQMRAKELEDKTAALIFVNTLVFEPFFNSNLPVPQSLNNL